MDCNHFASLFWKKDIIEAHSSYQSNITKLGYHLQHVLYLCLLDNPDCEFVNEYTGTVNKDGLDIDYWSIKNQCKIYLNLQTKPNSKNHRSSKETFRPNGINIIGIFEGKDFKKKTEKGFLKLGGKCLFDYLGIELETFERRLQEYRRNLPN
jgi:hypothetical protein